MVKYKTVAPGTAHYHAVKATEKFAEFAAAMQAEAHRTVAQREDRERNRAEHTTYAAREQSTEKES